MGRIMNIKSPLGSPTLPLAAASFTNKLPQQVKRILPLYLACASLLLIILNYDVLAAVPGPWSFFLHSEAPREQRQPGSTFPQKIWQTWKVDPLDFAQRDLLTARTWLENNPGMRYEVLTDGNEMSYIEHHYGPHGFNRLDIVDFYRSINLHIIKADLLRYMIMYAEGGVYADIDVEAIKPFHKFFPTRYDEMDFDMIVGIEVDQPQFRDHPILGSKSMSFCQWTIISRPRQPVMLKLVENIMAWLSGVAREQGVSVGDVELDFDQVISGTGPSAFTNALIEEMNKKHKGPQITWDTFHDLDESKVVGRVLVLTVEAFCAGQGHSNSGNHGSRGALVKHHYHASNWPHKHRRFTHPAYGPVEVCNWKPDCVQKWDENVAAFNTLPESEKARLIDEHQKSLMQKV
ncbi:Initiation-specific alpha-1,6-mannosyltransferase [Paramyrothecium foliicola]|nr:Initiation-specific alpha-1,6-mannosyltransferase [Paramyrothecium foliicola]